MFDFIWYDLLYQPLYNALIFFYSISGGFGADAVKDRDMGVAVIFLTIAIRMLLLPISIRGARSEHRLDRLQPVIDEIKVRYRYNIERQREGIRRLLQKNKIGIYSSIISLMFQILFFIVLYKIFSSGLQPAPGNEHNVLYGFMNRFISAVSGGTPLIIDPYFLGRINLLLPNSSLSLFAAGIMLFHQGIRRVTHISDASTLDKVLLIALPVGIYFGTIVLPASKALFIATSVIFSLWLRLIKTIVMRFMKDEKLKQSIEDLWTS